MKKFKRKYWVNLSWIKDDSNEERSEVYLYKTKSHCLATLPTGDELRQIEVREL